MNGMNSQQQLGGVIHTYQSYDPRRFPNPREPVPDVVSPVFNQMMMYGKRRKLTEEELARAIRIDPSQIAGLGPSLDALIAMLEERKRKILARYEVHGVRQEAKTCYREYGAGIKPPRKMRQQFEQAFAEEQLRDLERLWYHIGDDANRFAQRIVQLMDRLGNLYEVDELAAKYHFSGNESMSIPQAIAIKEELEKIDELLKQLHEARETAQIAIIDQDALAEFTEPGDLDSLTEMQKQAQELMRQIAENQGLEFSEGEYQLTPQAYRMFQSRILERVFSELQASRTGRHTGPVTGDGAVETQQTKAYEFGDSVANMDLTQSFINAIIRQGPRLPVQLNMEDIVIHRTQNRPKCATTVLMDMSGSMRYDGQYINVKQMGLALEALIHSEYPGDYLQFIEMATFAKPCNVGEIIELMPKPVTLHDPFIRLRIDMSREDINEHLVPPHFTNIQHALQMSRQMLASQDTPNRQIILITDGLPTAHYEGEMLYLLYPPDPQTELATMREAMLCQQEGITINIFLIPSWSQSNEDIQFAHRLAESTSGRLFITLGNDLDQYVIWDYISNRRDFLG